MVRKRGRHSKKYEYESDEEIDSSDLELDLDESSQTAPKQYSLRQRKRPLFTEDLDYDEEEDERRKKNESDDDFQVEDELSTPYASAPVCTQQNDYNNVPAAPEELIDFEDMIRADIVVNKRKMNAANSIEEETQPTGTSEQPKRGRPRNYPVADAPDVALSYFEPQIGVEEDEASGDEDDQDYDPVEDLEAINCSKEEEKVYEIEKSCNNDISSKQQCDLEDPLNITNEQSNEALCENSSPKPVSESPTKQHNGVTTPVQIPTSQIKDNLVKVGSQSPLLIEDDDDDDDDVVFIEDPSRSEIIVLDD